MMELVIKIPDEEYRWIKKSDETVFANVASKECMLHAIKNGIPLPEHHGRLIDVDETLRELGSYHIGGIDAIKKYNGENTWEDGLHTAWRVIDDAETIIEADEDEEDIPMEYYESGGI